MLPPLATARTRLEPATEHDVDALWRLFTDPVVRRFLWDDVVIEREQAVAAVKDSAEQNAAGRGLWTIRAHGAEALLGCVALLRAGAAAEFEPRMAGGDEVLVALATEAQHRGLAAEALAAVLDHAWRTLRLTEVFAAVDVPNEASHRAMLRAGFRVLGERDGPKHRLRSYRATPPAPAV